MSGRQTGANMRWETEIFGFEIWGSKAGVWGTIIKDAFKRSLKTFTYLYLQKTDW